MTRLSEADFQRQVTDLASLLGWEWLHVRAGQTTRGWRVPVSGTLGQGWPDLVLVHPRHRRVVFAELKRDGRHPTAEQDLVIDVLRESGLEVFVWHPADWDELVAVLRAPTTDRPLVDRPFGSSSPAPLGDGRTAPATGGTDRDGIEKRSLTTDSPFREGFIRVGE